jgi:hypothetical protein
MAQIDYLPVATGTLAEVDSQANFAGSSYQQNGFTAGIALPSEANKIWRQSSVMTAALARFISQQLGNINVLDDGNVTALVALILEAIQTVASSVAFPTVVVVPSSATPVFDCTQANNFMHAVFQLDMAQNVTSSTLINAKAGMLVTFIIKQVGGPWTFTPPAGLNNFGSVVPIIGATSTQMFVVDKTAANANAVSGVMQS